MIMAYRRYHGVELAKPSFPHDPKARHDITMAKIPPGDGLSS